jgi:hypothetical protein
MARPSRLLVPLLALALLTPQAAQAVQRSVPRGWLGVTAETDLLFKHHRLDHETALMARSGVETLRVPIYWSQLQPYATEAQVPAAARAHFTDVGGVPTDFHQLDRLVASAARHRIAVMAVLLGAPAWAAISTARPIWVPRDPAPYANALAALVRRYGTSGTFWAGRSPSMRTPVVTWQIWNEPSNIWYWDDTWASSYPRLLRAAYDAAKAADPHAQIVMAGINTTGGGTAGPTASWVSTARIYDDLDSQHLGRPFDAVAAHIYTSRVADAARVVEETRRVMSEHGDGRRPIYVSELSWPASQGRLRDASGRKRGFFAGTTDRGMARRLRQGVRLLAVDRRRLGIAGVLWFEWSSTYRGVGNAFLYSGLRRLRHHRLFDAPARRAFTRVAAALEGRRLGHP